MKLIKNLLIASAVSSLLISSSFANSNKLVKQGEKIFLTKKFGNCISCHAINGQELPNPGSFGPKLQYLSAWPAQALYDKIYDPYTTNPISAMPAFGKNGWLNDNEIKALVAYLQTIN